MSRPGCSITGTRRLPSTIPWWTRRRRTRRCARSSASSSRSATTPTSAPGSAGRTDRWPTAARASPFTAAVDWPQEFETTLPVRGGLGLFLTEVLSNAMRHGAAGSSPHVAVQCDRVRKELIFSVENRRRDGGPRPPSKYGGLSLLSGMARLFGWKDFSAAADGVLFVVSWRAPLTRRDQPGKPD